jgi:ATP-dependent Lon protease
MLGPLLDRIEMINVPAYLPIEKLNIANQYLIPDLTKEYGFNSDPAEEELVSAETVETVTEKSQEKVSNEKIVLTDAAIMDVINHYCAHEAGVRNLKKALDRVYRKVVAKLENLPEKDQEVSEGPIEYQINTKNLETFLDIPPTDDSYYININK